MFDHVHAELQEQLPEPDLSDQPPGELVVRLIDYLGDAYEFVAPFNRAIARSTGAPDLIETERNRMRSIAGGSLRAAFTAILPQTAKRSRVVRESIRLALSWKAWDQLRTEQEASVKHAKAVMLHTLTAILRDVGIDV